MGQGWRVVELDAVGSTNDEARRLAEQGEPGRVAVVARVQTAGRGRQGRAWVSPEGGLYLSAVVRPRLAAPRVGLLSLAAGLALTEVVEELGLRAELRWPNDVLVGGRKAGGVLCEARFRPDAAGLAWAVVGMGLNVAQPRESLAPVGGTTLAEALGRPLDPGALRAPVLEALDRAVGLAEEDPQRLLAAWSRRAAMLGRRVEVLTTSGRLAGLAERVEPTGGLVVRTPDGVRTVAEADLVRVLA